MSQGGSKGPVMQTLPGVLESAHHCAHTMVEAVIKCGSAPAKRVQGPFWEGSTPFSRVHTCSQAAPWRNLGKRPTSDGTTPLDPPQVKAAGAEAEADAAGMALNLSDLSNIRQFVDELLQKYKGQKVQGAGCHSTTAPLQPSCSSCGPCNYLEL